MGSSCPLIWLADSFLSLFYHHLYKALPQLLQQNNNNYKSMHKACELSICALESRLTLVLASPSKGQVTLQVFHQLFCGKVFCISDLDVVARVDFFFVFCFVLFKSLYLLHWDKYAYDTALTRHSSAPVPHSKAKVCKLATAVCCLFSEQIGPQDRPSGTLSFCCWCLPLWSSPWPVPCS